MESQEQEERTQYKTFRRASLYLSQQDQDLQEYRKTPVPFDGKATLPSDQSSRLLKNDMKVLSLDLSRPIARPIPRRASTGIGHEQPAGSDAASSFRPPPPSAYQFESAKDVEKELEQLRKALLEKAEKTLAKAGAIGKRPVRKGKKEFQI